MIKKDGLVALEHYNTNSKSVKLGDGTVYTFTPKHNVSLTWAKVEHAPELLSMRARICCGQTKPLCFYASETNVNIHETGNRYGE
jgi:hypothetical protein